MDVVTTCDRPDLEDEAGAAFRVKWPEFIFHDPIAKQDVAPVAEYFTHYDVLLLDEGRVVAGGWGVPIAWMTPQRTCLAVMTVPWLAPSKGIRAACRQRR